MVEPRDKASSLRSASPGNGETRGGPRDGCRMPAYPASDWPAWLLRPADQAAVAVLVLFGLLAMIGWWIGQGGLSGRLVEVEQAKPQQAQYLVDVNSADWPELAQLPGIGEVLARRIVEERTAGGPFRDLDDLQERVRGIGPATLERLRPFVAPLPPTTGLAEK